MTEEWKMVAHGPFVVEVDENAVVVVVVAYCV